MALELKKGKDVTIIQDKVKIVTDWLHEHYNIKLNYFDTTQISIESKDKDFEYSVTVQDLSLQMISDGIQCSKTMLRDILSSRNYMRVVNPIEEYFEKVRGTYKGYSHIDLLSSNIKVVDYGDKPANYYNIRAIKLLKKWIVAAAACALGKEPNPVQLVFVQEQEGTGKTTLANFLCPPELKEMFIKSSNDSKVFNIEQAFTSNFFVFFDEFIGLQGSNAAEEYKSTMTAKELKIKGKNDPIPITKPRIGSAVGTSNNKTGKNRGFLTRGLGLRRFAVIHIEELRDYRGKIDIDQIWAEALMLAEGNTGFDYVWSQDDFADLREVNVRYIIETPCVIIISQNYRMPNDDEDGEWMQPTEIIRDLKERKLLKSDFIRDITPERIGEALRTLGFVSKPKRFSGEKDPRYRYCLSRI